MAEGRQMRDLDTDLFKTLVGKEHAELLKEYDFSLVLDEDGSDFSCTVVQNSEVLIAFTFQRGFGENLAVAEIGSPINASSIADRKNGWSLIGEVWKEAYQEYHKVKKELPYPHEMGREQEAGLVDSIIRAFIAKVRNKEISISQPEYRMDK